jgi:hypothetical protein
MDEVEDNIDEEDKRDSIMLLLMLLKLFIVIITVGGIDLLLMSLIQSLTQAILQSHVQGFPSNERLIRSST